MFYFNNNSSNSSSEYWQFPFNSWNVRGWKKAFQKINPDANDDEVHAALAVELESLKKYFRKKSEKRKRIKFLLCKVKKVSISRSSQLRDNVLYIVPFIFMGGEEYLDAGRSPFFVKKMVVCRHV